ncbi:MAG: sulfatase-like hydrolase/transferase, partial [Victivallales bacterium]|nr:sulfatase-like hydrolase/transferase [Victivallales bacterium]
MRKKPNIVLFVPDSYRGDVLGHQGNAGAVTPNLDAIIDRDAVSYTNAFAQNPVCTPSRCSFMTGWYPHVHGHRSMRNMLKEYEPNLLTVLRNEGYYTWWGGKNDLVSLEKTEDYLKYCDEKFDSASKYIERMESYDSPLPLSPDDPRRGAMYSGVNFPGSVKQLDYDTACVLGAVDMIKNHSGENPFFCYLPLSKPHPPYYADEKFYNAIDPDKLPSRIPTPEDVNLSTILEALRTELRSDEITEEMWHEVKRVYYAMCSKIDDLFGKVVDALIEKGVYDDTWVFFFSDHGDFTGDYSLPEKTHATMQDCLVHVPLVVKPPKDVPVENGNRRHLVELLDVTATLYDMLEIDPGYAHQGISLRNSLSGDESVVHDAVFAEVGGRKGEEAFLNTQVYDFSPDNFYARQGKV